MRIFFGKILLWCTERVFGHPVCSVYRRFKKYPTQRIDGHRGQSPFFHSEIIRDFVHFFLIPNRYPYKGWNEHYLIVPRREIESLSELNDDESLELVRLLALYESQGYVIISQQFGVTKSSSIAHKHIHVLK